MRPERLSNQLFSVTRSKAKMWEYDIPLNRHIKIYSDPANLFPLSIGMLGRLSTKIISGTLTAENITTEVELADQFPARFLDSYYGTKLNPSLDQYLLVLGSASFYLCNMPGNSSVLVNRIGIEELNVEGNKLEHLLVWFLKGEFSEPFQLTTGRYRNFINKISSDFSQFILTGDGDAQVSRTFSQLRRLVYNDGSPRELLLCDAVFATAILRIQNSTWKCLPKYTGLPVTNWLETISRKNFIKEFWPSQHLLGEKGFFRGRSGIVQMPTSAGKTKAIDLIIRSAFLSERTNLAVIIAPFKALCREIKETLELSFENEEITINELSDVIQMDFDLGSLLYSNQVLVLTPEKFVYLLRNAPEIKETIGLVIYDEGHQFDSGIRGVTYELLLTSLKDIGALNRQTVLISAVISNAEAINLWLNGVDSEAAIGPHLKTTYRSIGFVNWQTEKKYGELEFVSTQNSELRDFFVPYVIHQEDLSKYKGERKDRTFPEKNDGKSISLYLGLKLCVNGSVAIFCGTKIIASGLCERLVDYFQRDLKLTKPIEHSNASEVGKISELYEMHFGKDSPLTKCAKIGIFSHHGNIPHGLRLAIEYSFQKGLLKFVICTSTLAQGVNLPIRYLIITSVYQGHDRIKIRDFHNLLGRAGRSGIYTEGSVIFADPEVYGDKSSAEGRRRWRQFKELLDEKNAEPCASTLISIFDRIKSDNGKKVLTRDPLDIIKRFLNNLVAMKKYAALIATQFSTETFTEKGVFSQLKWKLNIVSAIESYLLSHIDWEDEENLISNVEGLAANTLAFTLADEGQKSQLKKLFIQISENIQEKIPIKDKRKPFGKTLLGISVLLEIEQWVIENLELIKACEDSNALFECVWPIFSTHIHNHNYENLFPIGSRKILAKLWLDGIAYSRLHETMLANGVKFGSGLKPRNAKIDHIVDICENGFGYEGGLFIGAISELFKILAGDEILPLNSNFNLLQKRMRYGLPSKLSVDVYEFGFCDRVLVQDVTPLLDDGDDVHFVKVSEKLGIYRRAVGDVLTRYPIYFSEVAKKYL